MKTNCIKRIYNILYNRVFLRKDFMFIVASILFGVTLGVTPLCADDIAVYNRSGSDFASFAKWAYGHYYTWSSRQLINFTWTAILHSPRIVWIIYLIVTMFIFFMACEKLFITDDNRYDKMLYSVGMMMVFPFICIGTAGWIATSTSYFGPQILAIMSLVPIKKIYYDEKIKLWEYILYCICLIYGANSEQMCVVLFILYSVAVIYFLCKKRWSWKLFVLYILSIASVIYTATCPGNYNRSDLETATWFPTYHMLSVIDKADIGLSTTLKWLLLNGNPFVIIICVMFAYFIWKKYNDTLYRIIAIIPVLFTVLFGPLKNVVEVVFPFAKYVSEEIPYHVAICVENNGMGNSVTRLQIMLFVACCICIEVISVGEDSHFYKW